MDINKILIISVIILIVGGLFLRSLIFYTSIDPVIYYDVGYGQHWINIDGIGSWMFIIGVLVIIAIMLTILLKWLLKKMN